MGPGRVELPTSRLSGVRSRQLSYEPNTTWPKYQIIKHTALSKPNSGRRPRTLTGITLPRGGRPILRKEVIQPQVPLRLPCYDFTPIITHTLVRFLPKVGSRTSGINNFRGVTGGVYKARERIHRCMLISDY